MSVLRFSRGGVKGIEGEGGGGGVLIPISRATGLERKYRQRMSGHQWNMELHNGQPVGVSQHNCQAERSVIYMRTWLQKGGGDTLTNHRIKFHA